MSKEKWYNPEQRKMVLETLYQAENSLGGVSMASFSGQFPSFFN